MRLFVALLPPPDVLDEVDAAVRPLRTTWPGLQWIRRELWHVTLAFLGEVDEEALEELLPRLERAAARHPRLALSFAGAGAFPLKGARARVVWIGVYGDRRALAALAMSVTAGARRAGVSLGVERGRAHPHLTLARSRRPADVRPLVEELAGYAGPPWTATEVHLIRSHLGAVTSYETLRSWPLRLT